jgi:hypothetical protein
MYTTPYLGIRIEAPSMLRSVAQHHGIAAGRHYDLESHRRPLSRLHATQRGCYIHILSTFCCLDHILLRRVKHTRSDILRYTVYYYRQPYRLQSLRLRPTTYAHIPQTSHLIQRQTCLAMFHTLLRMFRYGTLTRGSGLHVIHTYTCSGM